MISCVGGTNGGMGRIDSYMGGIGSGVLGNVHYVSEMFSYMGVIVSWVGGKVSGVVEIASGEVKSRKGVGETISGVMEIPGDVGITRECPNNCTKIFCPHFLEVSDVFINLIWGNYLTGYGS